VSRQSEGVRKLKDRRFHHRADVHLSADSTLLGDAPEGVSNFTTETVDLSEGGAKIRIPDVLPLGQVLLLQLYLPDGTDHQCQARVVRSAPTEGAEEAGAWAAVQFIEPDVWMRIAIAGVIETAGGAGN
jgi:hypothetical protein